MVTVYIEVATRTFSEHRACRNSTKTTTGHCMAASLGIYLRITYSHRPKKLVVCVHSDIVGMKPSS